MRRLKKGVQVVVATPGRLLDLIGRKAVATGGIRCAVLDEADEMLGMGFQEDIHAILEQIPEGRRLCLFSATMPPAAREIADTFMKEPVEIVVGRRNEGADNIRHTCFVVREKDRYPALKRLIDYVPDIYGLIFCRTRKETRSVAEKLMKDGYNADALHGDLSQEQRNTVMRKFRERTLQILVATDVAARGLDVEEITHVINYNLPDESERYTHRSGRTARAGKSGDSLVLLNTREARRIGELERRTGVRFIRGRVPMGEDVCEKQLLAMVTRMVRVDVDQEAIEPYLPPVYEALSAIGREELIRRFVSVEFNRFLNYYRDSGDLNAGPADRKKPAQRKGRLSDEDVQSFFINVGRLDNIREGAIVRLICEKAGIRSDRIGRISMKREFSFFDVDKRSARKVFASLRGTVLDGRKIEIRFADRTRARIKKTRRQRKK
jgi:ATP-dependent RNA helicase DeaD